MIELLAPAAPHGLTLREGDDRPLAFEALAAPLAAEPEGGARCALCFRLRLGETARQAAQGGFDYFATTLTVSPHKNAPLINEIGQAAGATFGARYLPADFKKRDGYLHSIRLSEQYGLYRQNYCKKVYLRIFSNISISFIGNSLILIIAETGTAFPSSVLISIYPTRRTVRVFPSFVSNSAR